MFFFLEIMQNSSELLCALIMQSELLKHLFKLIHFHNWKEKVPDLVPLLGHMEGMVSTARKKLDNLI